MVQRGAQAPEELAERFAQFVAVADIGGIVGLYAADAIVTVARDREVVGPAGIRTAFEAALAAGDGLGVVGRVGGPVEGLVEGTVGAMVEGRAVRAGTLAMTSFTGIDGVVRTQVARREPDGRWLWVRDGSTLRHVVVLGPASGVDIPDVA
jgi:hypothetical protein